MRKRSKWARLLAVPSDAGQSRREMRTPEELKAALAADHVHGDRIHQNASFHDVLHEIWNVA